MIDGIHGLFTGDMKVLYRDSWKLFWRSDGRHQLFDLRDASVGMDIADMHPEIVVELVGELQDYISSFEDKKMQSGSSEFIHDDMKALRTLGYIE
ncbi:hypothetical protein JXA40_09510 [bacterium]|nr:hypothetical protein [candidate division CSSED10-310 bacterium]